MPSTHLSLHYHLVFSTKNREPLIAEAWCNRLHAYLGGTMRTLNGIAEEGSEIMKDFKGMPALDAGLLAAAQAVEHYEMSRYGTLRTWASELGMDDAARLLQATLDEEEATDAALTKLAESLVNVEAEQELAA